MKNNKGYTLVELLVTLAVFAIVMVELGSMIMNSSRLYRNGTYEVELQTEAQQIVQQVQELMIDVNHSVSFNGSVNSGCITISNNDLSGNSVIYTLSLNGVDPAQGYGTLYFSKEENGVSSVGPVEMAEYVQSISLNMDAYESDIVTLNVSMNNGRYGYESSQDIYLRNGIGSGGGHNYASGSSANAELIVLRFKEYDLTEILKKDFPDDTFTSFEWDPGDAADAAMQYDLNSSTGKLSASNSLNHNESAVGPFTVKATNSTGTFEVEIKVRSEAVGCGKNGSDVLFVNGTTGGYTMMAPVVVHGVNIDSNEITSFKIEAVYMTDDATPQRVEMPASSINPTLGPNGQPADGDCGIASFEYYEDVAHTGANRVKIDPSKLWFIANGNDNTLEVHMSGQLFCQYLNYSPSSDHPYYYYVRKTGAPLYYYVEVEYGSSLTLEMTLYVMPAAADSAVIPEDVANIYWNLLGLD